MSVKQEDQHPVELEIDHGVATVTLNRPHVRNAVNDAMRAELTAALERLANDDGVRAVVLTGKGAGFCSGGDIAGMQERLDAPAGDIAFIGWRRQKQLHRGVGVLHGMGKPTIAAVNGAAVGWGMELALFADIRIASEKAKFAELFVKRGLPCDVGGFYRLPAIVGPANFGTKILPSLSSPSPSWRPTSVSRRLRSFAIFSSRSRSSTIDCAPFVVEV